MARRAPSGKSWVGGAIIAALAVLAAFALIDAVGGSDPEASNDARPTSTSTSTLSRPASSPPVVTVEQPAAIDPDAARIRAPCPVLRFRLVFDRENGSAALLTENGRPLALVTPESRAFAGALCTGRRARAKPYAGRQLPALYDSGRLECAVEHRIEVEIHPTVDPAGRQVGNVLLVSEQGRAALVVSAIVDGDVPGRRVYYSDTYCDRI